MRVRVSPTRSRVVALLAVCLAFVTAAPAVALVPEPGSDGMGDAYFPLDGNGGIDVASYDVHDRYRFGSGKLTGWTMVRLTATQDLSSFNLDLLLTPRAVTIDGVAATFAKDGRHELVITPAAPITDGTTVDVRVSYAGHPGRLSWGGESNWLIQGREVVTMNEPHMAPWWFPANDHPRDKAAMDVHIRVPKRFQVISNGSRVGRTVHDDGSATTHWHAGTPMVPYLAYFAAGRFQIERGVTRGLRWYNAVSKQLSRRDRRASFDQLRRSARIVRWLEGQLVDYPFSSTGGLVTATGPGFALENQTRPTYPPLGPGSRSLVVHELAHQWLGDSVSVSNWRDIWLNEGAASFMEVRYRETHGGRSAKRWLADTYAAYSAQSSFWDLTIGDPGANHIFDYAVYVRGAMTFQALRNRIGNRDFWETLRTWLTDRRNGNGAIADFHALAESTSGENLDGFFDAWLFTGEKPNATAANGLG